MTYTGDFLQPTLGKWEITFWAVPPSPKKSIDEVALFLKLSKPTIYGFCSSRKIPYSKKGKRLYFNKTEINEWIIQDRKKTLVEMQNKPIHEILKPRRK